MFKRILKINLPQAQSIFLWGARQRVLSNFGRHFTRLFPSALQQNLKGLIAFCEEHEETQGIVVSQDRNPRLLEISPKFSLKILPWETFLKLLWTGEII